MVSAQSAACIFLQVPISAAPSLPKRILFVLNRDAEVLGGHLHMSAGTFLYQLPHCPLTS